MDEDNGSISNPMEADPGKMFIGGLHNQTTADGLQRYFEQYGEVKECVVMRDSVTKRSRGFGFVRFSDPKSVDKVSNCASHTIDGKKVDPKRAIPKRPPPGHNQFKKVFVGGLPPDTSAQDLKDYFEAYGKVTEVLLMHDKNTKRLRGFGFVTFESDVAGKHVCEAGFHKLKGKSVECKRAQPKEIMMLQGKGRGYIVNLAPFPFGRGYPGAFSPMGFGLPAEWALNPQLYQNLATMYSSAIYGRGRGYGGYAPQGFVNMPDHRRQGSQYYAEYASVQSPTGATRRDQASQSSNSVAAQDHANQHDFDQRHYSTVQLTQYGSQPSSLVAPPSPLTQAFNQTASPGPSDIGGYLHSSRAAGIGHDGHLTAYHNAHHPSNAQQATFGHGVPQITLRH